MGCSDDHVYMHPLTPSTHATSNLVTAQTELQ